MVPKYAIVIISALFLAGCVPIQQLSVSPISNTAAVGQSRFSGLADTLSNSAARHLTLRLLIVHGMGPTQIGYSQGLINQITEQLNLQSAGPVTNIFCADGAIISIRKFTHGPAKMVCYELDWFPITDPIKAFQFADDESPAKSYVRQIVNDELKARLMDDCLADVVLYLGAFRPRLQQPIMAAIQQMNADSEAKDDPIAIISHSLGSYMVMDTLKTMKNQNVPAAESDADYCAARINNIFMLANQLPILDLSDFTARAQAYPSRLRDFLQLRANAAQAHYGGAAPPRLQIVAFSDPNDLLSYELTPDDFPPQLTKSILGFNVRYTDEHWSILGLCSNPLGAHVNWWTDPKSPVFLTDGHLVNSH